MFIGHGYVRTINVGVKRVTRLGYRERGTKGVLYSSLRWGTKGVLYSYYVRAQEASTPSTPRAQKASSQRNNITLRRYPQITAPGRTGVRSTHILSDL